MTSLANIPVQKKFLEGIYNEKKTPDRRAPFCKRRKDCKERKHWIFGVLTNDTERCIIETYEAEHLLSYLYHRDLTQRCECGKFFPCATKEYKKAIINFRMAMNEFLCEKKKYDGKSTKNLNSLLDKLKGKHHYSFITTNYDLVLESILGPKKVDYCLEDGDNNKIKVIKLHGSINWLEERNYKDDELTGKYKKADLIQHILTNIGNNIENNLLEKSKVQNNNSMYCYKSADKIYTPITIPFFFQKNDWYSQRWRYLFKDILWKKAEELLSSSDVIIFIGYGFRKEDYPILALLNKTGWWEKVIVNIDKKEQEFLRKFDKHKCHRIKKYWKCMKEKDIKALVKFIEREK